MPNAFAIWLRDVFVSTSFVSGMLGTLVGGAITLAGQRVTMSETRRQRAEDRRLAHIARSSGIVFKLVKITSHIARAIEHYEGRFDLARQEGLDLDNPWAFCQQIANPGQKIHFEADELGTLLQLKAVATFNYVADFDNVHNTFIDLILTYSKEREKLQGMLATHAFDAKTGAASGDLTQEQHVRIQPYMFQCNNLIEQIMSFKNYIARGQRATGQVIEVMDQKLQFKIQLTWDKWGETSQS